MVHLTEAVIRSKTRVNVLGDVKNLNLWGQGITDVSVLAHIPNVEILSLSINSISSLRYFLHCKELKELYLRKNEIQFLEDIRFLMPLVHLRVLWLSDNPCSELPNYRQFVIANLPQLTKLDNQAIDAAELAAAQQHMPVLQPATSADLLHATEDVQQPTVDISTRTTAPSASSLPANPAQFKANLQRPEAPSSSGRNLLDYALTQQPASPGFLDPDAAPLEQWTRPQPATYTAPSVKSTGTLRPAAEWFPSWMKYRGRDDNYVFWQDKFKRCSLEIPAIEKRWTVFSSLWYLTMELKYVGIPPAVRYLWYLVWRAMMMQLYQAHKTLVLWQARVDAGLAARATDGTVTGFSRAMALRRLHWKNSLLGELLYALNVAKTGRVHMLPPEKQAQDMSPTETVHDECRVEQADGLLPCTAAYA
eukprot:gene6989-7203_t